jgi:hypothetical protein
MTESLVKEHFSKSREVAKQMLAGVQWPNIKTPMPQRANFPVRQPEVQKASLSTLIPTPKFRQYVLLKRATPARQKTRDVLKSDAGPPQTLEFADIFREYGPAYRAKYGNRMLPSHKKAMQDIEFCRTHFMGGHVYYCDACDEHVYTYHSCGNRHCPKCGSDRANNWRDKQVQPLLPVTYFLVTCTLPHTLNETAHSNQKLIYRLLFQSSADALQTLALNPEWLGAEIGMVGALHTWDRSIAYHLHVHYLVPAGGIDPITGRWKPAHPKFLVPGSALNTVFRAKFRDALKAETPQIFAQVPPETWSKKWVVHCKPVGDGKTALKYLTPYISRVALSNRRLVSMEHGEVIFRYKPRNTSWTTMTLDPMSFISRFLQHSLPKGFQKIRYFGFLHPSAKTRFNTLKEQFQENPSETNDKPEAEKSVEKQESSTNRHTPEEPGVCPHCGRPVRYLGRLPRWPASERPIQHQRGPPCK